LRSETFLQRLDPLLHSRLGVAARQQHHDTLVQADPLAVGVLREQAMETTRHADVELAAVGPGVDGLGERYPARPAAPAIDCAVDCVGGRASVQFLLDRTADVVALFGVQREDYTFSPRHHHRLRLCGYPGHSRGAAKHAVELIRQGRLDLAPLVTHHLPLERYDQGVDLVERQQAIKVCFWPWRE